MRKGNALKIPYKDNFFDKVICIDVIEHIKDDEKVLKEIKRVLKKEGEGIIYFVAGTLNPSIGHFHSYNFSSIVNMARKLDLKIKKLIIHRSILDKIINPLRKPAKIPKIKTSSILSKLLAKFMVIESLIPFCLFEDI